MRQTSSNHYGFRDRNGNTVLCHLDIYQHPADAPSQTIVVATEIATNPGQSITNCYEQLANSITTAHQLEPAHTLWIEHYNADSYIGKPLEPETSDRYSLVQLIWDGQQFSTPRFAPLRESQFKGLIGNQAQPQQMFDPKTLTLAGVNTVAGRYGLNVVSLSSGHYQPDPTLRLSGKDYVVVAADGTVLTTCKDLDSVSMFLTLWSLSHSPLATVDDTAALTRLNTIAQPKGLRVITSDTPGYRHHDWVIKYLCPYAVVNQYGTVLTTCKDLTTAEAVVLLQADQDTDPLAL